MTFSYPTLSNVLTVADATPQADAPALLIGTLGVPLFGIFGPLILVMLVAGAFGGRSRDHGNPSGLGLVIGLMVLFIVMLGLTVLVR